LPSRLKIYPIARGTPPLHDLIILPYFIEKVKGKAEKPAFFFVFNTACGTAKGRMGQESLKIEQKVAFLP
jgi:hypothetical protein